MLAYFALSAEPDPVTAASLLIAALGLALAARGRAVGLAIGGALLAFVFGFADAKLRTEMTRAPVLGKELRNVVVNGCVEVFERREKICVRITLRVVSLGELKPEETPYRVRVTLSKKAVYADGGRGGTEGHLAASARARIALLASTSDAPPGSASLGGTDYAMGKLESADLGRPAPLDLRFWAAIDGVRNAINARILAALPSERGETADALITGERGGISDEVNQAMRMAPTNRTRT